MNIVEKGKWKSVPIDKSLVNDNVFAGLGGIQILTDYEYNGQSTVFDVKSTVEKNTKREQKTKKKNAKVAKAIGKNTKVKALSPTSKTKGKTEDATGGAEKSSEIKRKKKRRGKNRRQKAKEKAEKEAASDSVANAEEAASPPTESIIPDTETGEAHEKFAKNNKPNKKKKSTKKAQLQDKRMLSIASLIDITDVDKHAPKDDTEMEQSEQSQGQKRKAEGADEGPKKKKKKKQKKAKKKQSTKDAEGVKIENEDEIVDGVAKPKSKPTKKVADMSKWKDLFVPEPVLEALSDIGFDAPTPIQCLTLPSAIRDRMDILGAAETGSGKTLAFGIPMIHNILQYKAVHADGRSDDDGGQPQDSDEEYDSGGEEPLEILEELESDKSGDEQSVDEDIEKDSLDLDHSDQDEEEEQEDDDDDESEEDDSEERGEEEEEEDDGGEYDLPPDKDEELFDLKDGEFGCIAAFNNVDFSWMEEEDGGTDDQEDSGVTSESAEDLMELAESSKPKPVKTAPLHGLVLTPTRELAIQVKDHLQQAVAHTDIKICCIVGGMAAQKQERLLKKNPEIVVATPGRFWELMQQGDPHLAKVNRLRTLVIDEADRMVEKGHFEELKNFFEFLKENEVNKRRRQTFVFSATLTMVHQAPTRLHHKKKKVKQLTAEDKLGALMDMIGLDPKAKKIDITRKVGTAEMLVESKINCTSDEKDIYMYYFLRQYPGRTLVFSNSKDCLRRLVSVFTILECKPLPLHADMHQRQRLKNLDRFKSDPNGLLLATDVAARGLDIPNVEHVIHYQVPRTSENYVHRSGRTARASKEGLSIVLVGQEDMTNYRKLIRSLNRSEELATFPVEQDFMSAMKERVGLARKIDKEEHKTLKRRKENMWFEKAAKEMDIDLDEDTLLNDLGDSHEQARQKQKVAYMRRDLKTLLSQPVIPRAFSGRYPTKMGKLDLPLNDATGGACAAARKEAKAKERINLQNTGDFMNKNKKSGKKRYKRKK